MSSKHYIVYHRKASRSRPASESSTSSIIGDNHSVKSRTSSFAAASEHGRAATVINITDEGHAQLHSESGEEEEDEDDHDSTGEAADAEVAAPVAEDPVEVLEDDIGPSDSASRPPSTRISIHRSSSRASGASRRQVPAPQPPSRRSTNSDLNRIDSRTSDQSEPRPPRRRPRPPRAPSNMAYYNQYEDEDYIHGPPQPGHGHGHPHPQWQHVRHANHYSPRTELTSLSQYPHQYQPPPAPHPPQPPPQPQQVVQYNPYQFHPQMPSPMGYPGGQQYYPPPQQMMPFMYPFGQYPPPSSPPPPGDEAATKMFEAHMMEMREIMSLSQQAAIARDKEREAALEAEKKAALAKAAKDEEERANAEKVAKAAQKAKEEAEKDAEKKAKEAEKAYEKALKEATEKAEKFEKEKKEAEEEAKKLKPPDDATRPPIKFIDAVQRKFVLPWKMCKTWKGMEELIQQAFVGVDHLETHVHEGHYDLIGPNGEIILPQVWESTVAPDWTIKMQMWQIAEEEPVMMMPDPPKAGKGKKGSKGKKNRPLSMPGAVLGGGPVEVVNMTPPAPPPPGKPKKNKNSGMGMLTFLAGGGNSRRSK